MGRNFGPLFVEFSKALLEFEVIIHVHSKKSLHSGPSLGSEWASRSMELLLNKDLLSRIENLSESKSNFGLFYVDVGDLVRGHNYRWGQNAAAANKIVDKGLETQKEKACNLVPFPAGGMFWVLTEAIRPLLELDWTYEDFPSELGQLLTT